MEQYQKQFLCRGCLGDQNLKLIKNSLLQETFDLLSGQEEDGSPYIFCYICRALLLKCHQFRQRCLLSANVLEGTLSVQVFPYQNATLSCPQVLSETVVYIGKEEPLTPENIKIEQNIHNDITIKSETEDDNFENDIETDYVNKIEYEDNKDLESETKNIDTIVTKNEESKAEIEDAQKAHKIKLPTKKLRRSKTKIETDITKTGPLPARTKRYKEKFKQVGKFFETKENMENFERIYNVKIVVLSEEEQLNEMMKRKRACTLEFKCDLCFISYVDEESLTKHFNKLHHPNRGDAVCNLCKKRYKNKTLLKRHTKLHRLKFVCNICNRVSLLSYLAAEHSNSHSGQHYKCEQCNKAFKRQSQYLSHIRLNHPSKCIWCEMCGESFVSETGLKAHHNIMHKQLVCPWDAKCENCNTQFLNKEAYEKHSSFCNKSSNNIEAFCVHCGENFEKELMLKDHLLQQHNMKDKKKFYSCTKCDRKFLNAERYGIHYRHIHENQPTNYRRSVICDQCGKTLRDKTTYRDHVAKWHTGDRKFQCPDCPKKFATMSALKGHSKAHSEERSYVCPLCPKTFKYKSGVKIHHLNVHEGVKLPQKKKKPNIL